MGHFDERQKRWISDDEEWELAKAKEEKQPKPMLSAESPAPPVSMNVSTCKHPLRPEERALGSQRRGQLWGSIGGKRAAESLGEEGRRERARKAAQKRWADKKIDSGQSQT